MPRPVIIAAVGIILLAILSCVAILFTRSRRQQHRKVFETSKESLGNGRISRQRPTWATWITVPLALLGLGLYILGAVDVHMAAHQRHQDSTDDLTSRPPCPVFYENSPDGGINFDRPCDRRQPRSFLAASSVPGPTEVVEDSTWEDLVAAYRVMQSMYYDRSVGIWPTACQWTAAMAGTVLSGVMKTFVEHAPRIPDQEAHTNSINGMLVDIVSSYHGQEHIELRGEAFDDQLWVVLGWLDSITAVQARLDSDHFPTIQGDGWYGKEWIPAFAHRARIFWEIAETGWDTAFCGGGMIWNKNLAPYKNSITNELWIAASSSMYMDFPGDDNSSPFAPRQVRNEKYLRAAIKGYEWMESANLKNSLGLYIDGYHIANWDRGGSRCNEPDPMTFTYNQGVLLSGQYNLWRATGNARYLVDGHRLIQSVLSATGWDLARNQPVDDVSSLGPDKLPPWKGMGRGGVMEEQCDANADCSQDEQIFKGVFFYHFTAFCRKLPAIAPRETLHVDTEGLRDVRTAHADACRAYQGWVHHNVRAALGTLDGRGRAGAWWGAGIFHPPRSSPPGAAAEAAAEAAVPDVNDRGRGRSVETQVSLVALLRAAYEGGSTANNKESWGGWMEVFFWI